ncbi:MAG: sigma-70 family RNA polymerase sigma factor [Actinomycetota bacterium]|nr:sigma-70 family RNA polymerase sigma factor [Actinomycetota bacterium]
MANDAGSDNELLARFLDGDDASFTALVIRHEERIFSLALRMIGDRSDALEATQETFISAFRRARMFRGESAFGTWLYSIGVNACRDLLRRKKRSPVPSEALPEPVQTGPSDEDLVLTRLDLARALDELSEEYRQAVVMHDVGGIPYEEIALRLGVPVGTVKSRISRGRRLLAGLLEQEPEGRTSKEMT